MARVLLDIRPLRASADFRRLWASTTVSTMGGQLTVFAVMLQVWEMTGSALWLGAIGLAHAVPTVTVSLVGGSIADGRDRRNVVVFTAAAQLGVALLLAAQAFAGVESPALVLALVAALSSFASLGAPARRTLVPRLLSRDLLPAGLALTHSSFQLAMLVGPSVAGLVAAGWGVEACYALDAATFAVAAYGVLRLPPMRPEPSPDASGDSPPTQPRPMVRTWRGLQYIAHRPVVRGAVLSDLAATVLAMPVALFPVVNEDRFGGSPETLGLFLSSVAVGGVVASVLSSTFTDVRRQGRLMLASAATWGASLTAFALVESLALTLVTLAIAGAADTVSVVARGAIVHSSTTDDYRGRVAAVEGIVGVAGPDVGNFRAGMVASWTSHEVALLTGGLACVTGVTAIAWRNAPLRRFTMHP